jgi:hypothetical protein
VISWLSEILSFSDSVVFQGSCMFHSCNAFNLFKFFDFC